MPVTTRLVLNAAGMSLPIACAGQSFVGINVLGSWVQTLVFEGSTDGINFIPLSAMPFPSGTAVSQTTANGTWYVPVKNFVVIQVRASSFTSGSATVILAASIDSTYQDAFVAAATLFVTHAATGAVNTLTQTASTNSAWSLTFLQIDASSTPSWLTQPHVQIKDGSTILWEFNLPTVGSSGQLWNIQLPDGGITNTPGNSMVVVVANAQGSVTTNINAQFKRA